MVQLSGCMGSYSAKMGLGYELLGLEEHELTSACLRNCLCE